MSSFEGYMGGDSGQGYVGGGAGDGYASGSTTQGYAGQDAGQGYAGGDRGYGYDHYGGNNASRVATTPQPSGQYASDDMSAMNRNTTPPPGSITKFATPPSQQQEPHPQNPAASDFTSYAARSAMAHAATGGIPPVPTTAAATTPTAASASSKLTESPAVQAQQNRILTDATRKVQEHAYYMKQAMDKDDLPSVLDRAAHMVGELGDNHAPLTPKNYYELHMRALDDMPNLEEYFLAIKPTRQVYDAVQYCPRVLSRLYLQICAGSALLRSKEAGAKWVLHDLTEAVKCVQNPVRGLFLRHFLLQVFRDKLPDGEEESSENEMASGTVKDAYEFVLANFIEMNKLWVRIQHLPGEGKNKEQRKRRERERNELRILVGTNLVRLSQMEGVTSQIYGQVILPKILDQITACGDPLAQAYLIDCIIQVFPDEYHIETLSILLSVCPKLRDKVNIRTILQSLMDRLANYYAEEELLDETDTNEVKKSLAQDSFVMFEECVQNVYNARGPKLLPKEVIRLQTALLTFSLKCYPGNMDQVNRCLGVCVTSLRQANKGIPEEGTIVELPVDRKLDEASVSDLQKLLSIPLDSLALKVLELDHYSDLLTFLPWSNRRDVGLTMLRAIITSGGTPRHVKEIEELFSIIAPVIRDEGSTPASTLEPSARTNDLMRGLGISTKASMSFGPSADVGPERAREMDEEKNLVSKLVNLLDHEDTDVAYEMLTVARNHLSTGGRTRIGYTLVPIVFSALRLVNRVYALEHDVPVKTETPTIEKVEIENVSKPDTSSQETTGSEAASQVGEVPAFETKVAGNETTNSTDPPTTGIAEKETSEDVMQTEDLNEDESLAKKNDAVITNASLLEQLVQSNEPSESNGDLPIDFLNPNEARPKKSVSCRKIFVFLQKTIAMLATTKAELGIKLYLDTALAANNFADAGSKDEFATIAYELIAQAFVLYEEEINDSKVQQRCILSMVGTLLACGALGREEYESLITKAAQYSAKLLKKPEQCHMVALCSRMFFTTGQKIHVYRNPQRALECLQRALKLADSSTSLSPSNVYLFVDLLEHYVHFYEHENPCVTDNYVSGLIALIKAHLDSITPMAGADVSAIGDAKAHFHEILQYIRRKKAETDTSERFASIQIAS